MDEENMSDLSLEPGAELQTGTRLWEGNIPSCFGCGTAPLWLRPSRNVCEKCKRIYLTGCARSHHQPTACRQPTAASDSFHTTGEGIVSKALAGPTHLCTLPGIKSASEAVKGRKSCLSAINFPPALIFKGPRQSKVPMRTFFWFNANMSSLQ